MAIQYQGKSHRSFKHFLHSLYGFFFGSVYETIRKMEIGETSLFTCAMISAGFGGTYFFLKLGLAFWDLDYKIYDTEQEIQVDEGGFQERDLKKLALEFQGEFRAIILGRKPSPGLKND